MHFKTDHWWISARQKHQHLHMINFFTRCRDKGSCPWTKQSYMGKCSKGKLRTSSLVNDGTLRSTANVASALSNVNNVKVSDLLAFLVMLLFFSLCSHPKIICRKLQDYGSILGRDYFLISFSPATLQKRSRMTTFLWSYFFQSLKKSKKPVSEKVKQRFYS